ncbi:uncharacterized protein KIAA2013 homolog isoform X2 [Oratosquilla oratoria]|uniref:uncharacterized protein KIAA2013 homolog isoform X2 n=1 Tax=Oratosquilla oratoria TaxID=337810 RepID=UPI003F77427C
MAIDKMLSVFVERIIEGAMDINDVIKRAKRALDGYISYRKAVLLILVLLVLLLYLGPSIFRVVIFRRPAQLSQDAASRSVTMRVDRFWQQISEGNAHVIHSPPEPDERPFLPYIGNGLLGITLDQDSPIYIKGGRTLSVPINYRPVTLISIDGMNVKEAIVTEYTSGIIYRIQSWDRPGVRPIDITYQYYAHRTLPNLLLQDIKVINPTEDNIIVDVDHMGLGDWPSANADVIKLQHGDGEHEYTVVTGNIDAANQDEVIPVSIVTLKVPSSLQVKARMSTTLHVVTSVNYTDPIPRESFDEVKKESEQHAIEILKEAVTGNIKKLRSSHMNVWKALWSPGFYISPSKAENALNGDLINATIYSVLSQSRAFLYEHKTSKERREAIQHDLAYSEGCYGGHHTLEAPTLWSKLDSIVDINNVVSLWMMTLEKQGCPLLTRAGADGVMQAMLLSFGGLRFKNQHLEFNVLPKYLHRDYHFRRLSYGNGTHLNISVVVQEEDYKAVLYVALDRSDKNYYACDAGCLDPPVQLGPTKQMFPVKLTEPVTAILYITWDRIHMEELKHTIHVKEIALAPPHEHHVIALHRHGHKWGGLPTLFWFTVVALIVIFHLFLFKLVVNEYCGGDVKHRYRRPMAPGNLDIATRLFVGHSGKIL